MHDPDGLGVLCARASEWFVAQGKSVLPSVLLKDFWVTEALRVMARPYKDQAQSDDQVQVAVRPVFKGGTSLSKGLQLIDRFSEDIDICLEVLPAGADLTQHELTEAQCGKGRADRIMKELAVRVGVELGVEPETPVLPAHKGTKGVKRKWYLKYPLPASHGAGNLKDASFEMAVLSPERTLVDKLCIVHRLAVERQAQQRPLSWQVRHYYDIGRILGDTSVVRTLQASENLVVRYAAEAQQSTARHRGSNAHPRPDDGFATSPAFQDDAHFTVVAAEYQAELASLVMGPLLPLEDVLARVQEHAVLL